MNNVPRRHHVIPRFVQEGFASRTSRGEVYVWQYRARTAPRECNTRNVATVRDYHQSRAVPKIEHRISQFENRFAASFRAIRHGRLNELPLGEIDQFFRHFAIRLPIARRFLEAGLRGFLSMMRSQIAEEPRKPVIYDTIDEAINASIVSLKEMGADSSTAGHETRRLADVLARDFEAVIYNNALSAALEVFDTLDVSAHIRERHSEELVDETSRLWEQPPDVGAMRWSTRHSNNSLRASKSSVPAAASAVAG